MYEFLDRPAWSLDEPYRFLLAAMRGWVSAARAGRCPCAALTGGFEARRVPDALGHFGMAMAALDVDGLGTLQFGAPGCLCVSDDEARLLAAFRAAVVGDGEALGRMAAALVAEEACGRFVAAARFVAGELGAGATL
jgi:hypothetical protein